MSSHAHAGESYGVEGAGSDGVTICRSASEVRTAFGKLEGTKNILGLQNYAVLCQEFLAGIEWVVDTVSRQGEHKVVALWRYDKRDYYGSDRHAAIELMTRAIRLPAAAIDGSWGPPLPSDCVSESHPRTRPRRVPWNAAVQCGE